MVRDDDENDADADPNAIDRMKEEDEGNLRAMEGEVVEEMAALSGEFSAAGDGVDLVMVLAVTVVVVLPSAAKVAPSFPLRPPSPFPRERGAGRWRRRERGRRFPRAAGGPAEVPTVTTTSTAAAAAAAVLAVTWWRPWVKIQPRRIKVKSQIRARTTRQRRRQCPMPATRSMMRCRCTCVSCRPPLACSGRWT